MVGQVLSRLRRVAGLTQADVAASLKYSAARMSRLESGEADATAEEISQILATIDTPSAREFGDYLSQPWAELSQPPFEHPNRSDLWRADLILRRISALLTEPDLKNAFVEQVKLYQAEVRRASEFLTSTSPKSGFHWEHWRRQDHGDLFAGRPSVARRAGARWTGEPRPANGA